MGDSIDRQHTKESMPLDEFKRDLSELKNTVRGNEIYPENAIPPNIKTLYKTLATVKSETLSDMTFSLVIKNARVDDVMSGTYRTNFIDNFNMYVTNTKKGKKADKNIKEMLNISETAPIKIRWGNVAYGSEIDEDQKNIESIIVYLQEEGSGEEIPLMVIKQVYNNKGSYEVWSSYTKTMTGDRQKIAILPKRNTDGSYHLEDSQGKQLEGWYAIGFDGNLYEIDENMKVIFPSGESLSYESKYFASLRNGETPIQYGKDGKFSFPYDKQTETTMKREKIEIKQQKIMESCQDKDRYIKGYRLKFDTEDDTCFLEKEGIQSDRSPSVFSYEEESFSLWITESMQKIDEGIKTIEVQNAQIEKKEKVFTDFIERYCDPEDLSLPGVFPIKNEITEASGIEATYISALQTYNHRYGIKKWEKAGYNESANITIVDMTTGNLIESNFYYPTTMVNAAGNVIPEILSNIYMSIKRQENKVSYMGFFQKYTNMDEDSVKYGSFPKLPYTYHDKTYDIRFDLGDNTVNSIKNDSREYTLHIRGNDLDVSIQISKDMKLEDIEKSINNAIEGI